MEAQLQRITFESTPGWCAGWQEFVQSDRNCNYVIIREGPAIVLVYWILESDCYQCAGSCCVFELWIPVTKTAQLQVMARYVGVWQSLCHIVCAAFLHGLVYTLQACAVCSVRQRIR